MRFFILVAFSCLWIKTATADDDAQKPGGYRIGREVSIQLRLADDAEFMLPVPELVSVGRKLFEANWTEQEGGGRPLTKGTGKPLSDLNSPLVGTRSFNRISAPDANSCAGCHNAPFGIAGGGGDFVTNVFVLGQRFDFLTFDSNDKVRTRGALNEQMKQMTLDNVANSRATTGLFGAGYLEMLARQMTHDLQTIRDGLTMGQAKPLVSKGISFGVIARSANGLWDVSGVEGLTRASTISGGAHDPPSLVVRPWHQSSNVVSLREFSNTSLNQHHGIQSTERFGVGTDLDGDGFTNELSRAELTALAVYQATLQVPGRVIPNDVAVENAVLLGEKAFDSFGCASCHRTSLPLDKQGWIYSEPNPYNPATNLRPGDAKTLLVDLSSDSLPQPRLRPSVDGRIAVPAFTDLKVHNLCDAGEGSPEPLDQNQMTWSPKFREGNCMFLTKRLWGAANEPPYFHHGLFATMRQAVLAHAGEALQSRKAFQSASEMEQDSLIEFLKTLQVLPPGSNALVVDENFRPKRWPPTLGNH